MKKVMDRNLKTLERAIVLKVMKSSANVNVLRTISSYDLAYNLASSLVNGLHSPVPMAMLAMGLGRSVLAPFESVEMDMKARRVRQFHVGALLLEVAFDLNIIRVERPKGKNTMLMVFPKDFEYLFLLNFHVKVEYDESYVQTAALEMPGDYTSFYHPYAHGFVHGAHSDVKKITHPDNCPLLYKLVNAQMKIPYSVNTKVRNILKECQEDELFTRSKDTLSMKQRESLEHRDIEIFKEADRIGDNPFWLYSYLDYRSRFYYCSSYLTPQGTSLAKSLIKFGDKVKLGPTGMWSLMVNAANVFGYDKAALTERFDFAEDNLSVWMEIASNPVEDKRWQTADDPTNFLAAILEIKDALDSGNVEEFESNLMVGWDCSISGLQILSAIARDRVGAAQCNLLDTKERSDFYIFVADACWKSVNTDQSKADIKFMKSISAKLDAFRDDIFAAYGKENKVAIEQAKAKSKEFNVKHKEDIGKAAAIFWGQPHIAAKRRSVVKKGCLSYFYSCGARTMSEDIRTTFETEAGFEGLNLFYANWLGNQVFASCQKEMPTTTALMKLFQELAQRSSEKKKDFGFVAPVTGFTMKQFYREREFAQVAFTAKRTKHTCKLFTGNLDKIAAGKAKKGVAANITHTFDASLLYKILTVADYPVSLVHDCYFAHAGNAGQLLRDSRVAFSELFKADWLKDICKQHDSMDLYEAFPMGDWKSTEMLNNDYCIS